MKTQMWFLSIAARDKNKPLDWYLNVGNNVTPSPKSPEIGSVNHQNMSGVSWCISGVSFLYQHYTNEVHTSSLFVPSGYLT